MDIQNRVDAVPTKIKLDDLSRREIQSKTTFVDKCEYTNNWVSNCDFDTSSEISSSLVDSEDLDSTIDLKSLNLDTKSSEGESTQSSTIVKSVPDTDNVHHILQTAFSASNSMLTVENVVIENSKQIHIGNVFNISGPIHITHTSGGSKTSDTPATNKDTSNRHNKGTDDNENEVNEKRENGAFLGSISRHRPDGVLAIVERRAWLAQKPLAPWDVLEEPVPYVIISHTATENAHTQADNVFLCRTIQTFHIESCRWDDIGYNFLIGGDGNIYEGRGWSVIGAHTLGYNKKSIGISFIGCFMTELPPDSSLSACQLLIQKGVENGHIAADYKLLGHCQCSPTESPGRKLYEIIQTWPHFYS